MNGKLQTTALKEVDESYWNQVAQDYDNEIFSVLANDHKNIIASKISHFGSKTAIACDFGCGVGKFLPILSKAFRCIYAVDISEVCLEQAQDNCQHLRNVIYSRIDLSAGETKLKKAHFGLSVNVAIMPSQVQRTAVFSTISKHLYRGGHLLLVVPSLESALYADFRLVQWNLRAGLTGADALSELAEPAQVADRSLQQGIVEINGVPTKHYLKEELLAMFENSPLGVVSIEKVEYLWATEFDQPPGWMKEPYPWDWMAVLKKR
ncbi:MAG: methyltransferase domain-containing protein [Planctomycetota bacterium]|jgi:2-polyprenyl-3-methyl-5-hydroxy-6-metoxy-1,4-benzoquinol methylase